MTIERWTGALACDLQNAAGMTNERFADWLGIATRTVAYWHSKPDMVPGNPNQEILDAALSRLSDSKRDAFLHRVRQVTAGDSRSSADQVSVVVSNTVDSVENDPLLLGLSHQVDSVESLQSEVAVLARASSMAAFDVFSSARRLREEARRLVDLTRRPTLLADLYAAIGQTTSLMASTALRPGSLERVSGTGACLHQVRRPGGTRIAQGMDLRPSAHTGELAQRTRRSHLLLRARHSRRTAGEPQLRLRYIAARSYTLLGDGGTVAELLEEAERDRDTASTRSDELSSSIGGEFAFGEARAAACAAAGWLDLHNGEEAHKHAAIALTSYESLPAARRPYSQINGTLIDIAAARLLMNDQDGAGAALQPVLSLPPAKRNVSLAGRLTRVRDLLPAQQGRDASPAAQLREQITQWLAETSTRPLT